VRLAEVCHVHARVGLDDTVLRRDLAGDQVEERTLALAVLADHGDAIAHLDVERQSADQLRAAVVCEAEILDPEQGVPPERCGAEPERQAVEVLQLLALLELLELLDARLDLPRFRGLVAEPLDEPLGLAPAALLAEPGLLVQLLLPREH